MRDFQHSCGTMDCVDAHDNWTKQVSVRLRFPSVIKSSGLLLPRLCLSRGIKAVQKIETSIRSNPTGFSGRIIYVPGIGPCVLPS